MKNLPAIHLNTTAIAEKGNLSVTVGISTRNRPEHLRKALDSVFAQSLRPLEVLVIDDASDPPLVPLASPEGIILKWQRYEQNRGYIRARNNMMSLSRGKYFVSLDDDAFFTDRLALYRATAFMENHPIAGVLSFTILPPGTATKNISEENSLPAVPTHRFTGCGHMLRLDVLEKTGNYREMFFHQGEEDDISYRILHGGYELYEFPSVSVIHNYTPQARNWERMAFYGSRNGLLIIWLNQPLTFIPIMTVNFIIKVVIHHIRRKTIHPCLKGLIDAVNCLSYVAQNRQPVTAKTIFTILRRQKENKRANIRWQKMKNHR